MTTLAVDLDDIEFWEKEGAESQVRSSGIDSSHVDDLAASIKAKGMKKPVILELIPGAKGKYRCVDGNHRCAAVKQINKERDSKYPIKIKAKIKNYKSSAERLEEQIVANHHDPSLKNTFKDIKRVFIKLVKEENRCGNLSSLETDKEKIQTIKDYVDDKLPGYKSSRKVANAVWNALPQDIKKIKGYTKIQAIEEFNQKNLLDVEPVSRSGEYGDGKAPYFCGDHGFFNTTVGQAIKKKIAHKDDVDIVLVSWLGKSTGKEPKDVRTWRNTVLKDVKKINDYCGKKLFSKVLFLPQILQDSDGNDIDDHLLIEEEL